MITDQEHKIQEEKEEKTNWKEKVKHEFPFDWPGCLAAIQTAKSILGAETLNQDVNWEEIYQACQVHRSDIFSSIYNKEEVARINQCYQQFIRGEASALENIYYFSDGSIRISLSQLLTLLKNTDCKLTSLDIRGNQIGNAGAKEIADVLKREYCKLTLLNLRHNNIGDTGASEIAAGLKSEHCKLTLLDFGYNNIYEAGAKEIAMALKSGHCKLMSLDFGENQIGAAGIKEIARALKSEYCKLTLLYLSRNNIGDAGAKEIAAALKNEHCKLTSLHLGSNYIGNVGASEIANVLKSKYCKLKSLNLWFNQIGTAGVKEISMALKSEHCKLISLDFGWNKIGDIGVKEITATLKSEHCRLTSLGLGWNQISDIGVKEIAIALKSEHCKLMSLDLRSNQITEVGAQTIALALKHPHCSHNLRIEWESNMEEYILKFNKEWYQAQALYTLLSHPDGKLQHLSVLPPYVTIKCLFPYLFDIFLDELKPVTEEKQVEIPTYEHDDQGNIKTNDGKPIVIKSSWELRDVSTGELEVPQSQVGNCFLDNHKNHFEIMRAQRQTTLKSYEAKSDRKEAETHTVYKCN